MFRLECMEDTIAAISTATGQGGIGIVRINGKEACSIADRLFVAKNKKQPSEFKTFSVHYGVIVDKTGTSGGEEGVILDEALLTVMRAPASYTKEDMVEISCHGGIVSMRAILKLAMNFGARLAEPGEFTKRAFLNGRIDLTQAEAVLDIIQSRTEAFLKASTNQLKGRLSVELEAIREILMNIYTKVEAVVNFPEDGIKDGGKDALFKDVDSVMRKTGALLSSSEHGRILREGIKIVFCGKPNVGKSSLLNIFLKEQRAIVSEIAGTTRDTIEEAMQIKGIPFHLVDTAGMLEPRDLIEEEAVKRSRMHIKSAEIVLFILDSSQGLSPEDEQLIKYLKDSNVMVVLNKWDLDHRIEEDRIKKEFTGQKIFKVSAVTSVGIEDLKNEIVENVSCCKTVYNKSNSIIVTNLRHIKALKNCCGVLENARKILKDGLSLEFFSEEIKIAINYLDNITGRNLDNDLLENIFSQFCIGK